MKTNKIVMLAAMSIITVLPIIAISAVSCGKNITNSSAEDKPEDNPIIDPIVPEEPIIPDTPVIPDVPATPETPTTPTVPTVQNVEVSRYFDRFEVVVTGANLSCDVNQYVFQSITSTNQNEIKAKEIKVVRTNQRLHLF